MSGDVTLVDTGDGAVRRLASTAAELFGPKASRPLGDIFISELTDR